MFIMITCNINRLIPFYVIFCTCTCINRNHTSLYINQVNSNSLTAIL